VGVIEDVWLSALPDEDRYVWEGPGSPRIWDYMVGPFEINEFLEIKDTPTRLNTSKSMIFMLSLGKGRSDKWQVSNLTIATRKQTGSLQLLPALSLSRFISAIIR
jgi:hypothetical protein